MNTKATRRAKAESAKKRPARKRRRPLVVLVVRLQGEQLDLFDQAAERSDDAGERADPAARADA